MPRIIANVAANKLQKSEDYTPEMRKQFVDAFTEGLTNATSPGTYSTREKTQEISKSLQQKSDRYGDKNFIDFAKEGKWGKVVGDVMLEGARSLPYTIEAMISVPASLTTTGISSTMDKYDELSQRTDLNELQKVTKSILSGS